jgi:hypothetical protein
MKKFLLVLICILFLIVLASCEENTKLNDTGTKSDRFVRVYNGDFQVFVDTETNVQYLCDYATGGGVEWIVLVDTEGKPLLYKGDE